MSTMELVRYDKPDSIEFAAKAWPTIEKIARTEFVPGALRGKPEACLACVMYGHELGIGTMQSLAKIHVIDGRPAMSAELMRAVILAAGHEVWIEESSNTRVTIGMKRADSTREQRFTWTLDDAKKAGLQGRANWQKYPRAMLLARATGEGGRAVFPDVLAGISYTLEELTDGDVVDPTDLITDNAGEAPTAPAAVPAKKTAAAKKAATRKSPPAPPTRGEEPPLPGEDETPPDPGDTHTQTEARPLPGPAAIAVALKEKGIENRDDKLRVCAVVLDIDELESTKDLTGEQVTEVLQYVAALSPEALADLLIDDAEVVEPDAVDEGTKSPGPRQDPPAPPRDDAAGSPDSWSDAAWRTFLSERGVKVTELLKEAQRLAREDGDQGPTTLAELAQCSPSLLELLVGFVEDLAAQRSGS